MRFIDLFAGVGGFHLGFRQANHAECSEAKRNIGDLAGIGQGRCNEKASNGRFECVWANEWDKYAGKVYQERFPQTPFCGSDIRLVKADDIPSADLLCAGFPCQPFSLAGKRKGFEEARGTLFYEILRIAGDKRIPYLLLENVKGLLSAQNGWAFHTIISSLDELGYVCQWEVLNSKNFGVPQNRERVFIVGCLGEKRFKQVFPLGKSYEIDSKQERNREFQEQNISNCLRTNYSKGYSNETYVQENELIELPKNAQSLQTDGMLYQGSSWGTNNPESSRAIRRLTPTECERLQGFPDGWTKVDGISETQRYKMLGNAVTVNVVQAIGERLLEVGLE